MDTEEVSSLFVQTLTGDPESEEAWSAIRALRLDGNREIFEPAAAWCVSEEPLKRARGAAILCQLRRTSGEFLYCDESYALISNMLPNEHDPYVLDACIALRSSSCSPRRRAPLVRPESAVRLGHRPITVNGCIRVLSNPYLTVKATPLEVAGRLRSLCSAAGHHFWAASIALTDDALFRLSLIGGHQKITDAYLLALAVRNHGRLATFDQNIPMKAVQGAGPGNITLIGRI
jgi:predicted nucleic acid-binding protein